jgi:hypothetical protein
VLVIDEEAPAAEFTEAGTQAVAAVAQAAAVEIAEAEDPVEQLAPVEIPEPAAEASADHAVPAVLELTVPDGAESEVTLPLKIRLNHKGELLELQLSLNLRLRG